MTGRQWFEKNRFASTQAYPDQGQHVVYLLPQSSRIGCNSQGTVLRRTISNYAYSPRHFIITLVVAIATLTLPATSISANTQMDLSALSVQAREGDAVAQYDLANAYLTGTGLPKNPERALTWLEKSARGGNVSAQLLIAHLYYTGLHTQRNITLAMEFWRQAAENDNADGQYKLATVLLNRSANQRDIEVANNLLLTAWNKGHQQAGDMLLALGQSLPSRNTTVIANPPETNGGSEAVQAEPDLVESGQESDQLAINTAIENDPGTPDAVDQNLSRLGEPTPEIDAATLTDDDWIFGQTPNNYTIQLASFSDATASDFFLLRNNLQEKEQLQTIRSADKQWTYVLLGIYPNAESANPDVASISEKLEPWVRSFTSIQRNRCAQLKTSAPDRHAKYCQIFNQ